MKIRVGLIIVPVVILVLALAGGFVLLWRLFFLSLLVILLSYLWTLLGSRGLKGQVRKSAERCQVGEWFNEKITVLNSSRIPKLLINIQENTDFPGHHNMRALNLSPGGSSSWQAEVYCKRRGQYTLGTLTATVADPFGLFSLSRSFTEPQNILVYPATLELPAFQPLSRNEQPGYGPSRWLTSEVGPNAARVREYANGDTLNRIHWQSTAHTGKLMVKEFDPDRSSYASRNIWVIPDMQQPAQLGDGDGGTEECCITIAASLINKYMDNGKQVGLITSGDQSHLFPPQIGDQHFWHMLEALALIKATGDMPIEQLVSHRIEHFGVNSAIIVITPSTSERLTASLRQVKNRGTLVIVILLDSVSFGGTVSTANTVSSLVSSGFQVYVIRKGEELARALDSRLPVSRMRHSADVALE